MVGIVVLVVALVVSAVGAVAVTWRNGRFSDVAAPAPAATAVDVELLTADVIGAPLGERATLVQFSSAFCSPCRATRLLLTDIAGRVGGVETVEIDAESHLDLVRRLHIMRTPTVLVLDAGGSVTTRASGLPRRDQVMAALDRATADSSSM